MSAQVSKKGSKKLEKAAIATGKPQVDVEDVEDEFQDASGGGDSKTTKKQSKKTLKSTVEQGKTLLF